MTLFNKCICFFIFVFSFSLLYGCAPATDVSEDHEDIELLKLKIENQKRKREKEILAEKLPEDTSILNELALQTICNKPPFKDKNNKLKCFDPKFVTNCSIDTGVEIKRIYLGSFTGDNQIIASYDNCSVKGKNGSVLLGSANKNNFLTVLSHLPNIDTERCILIDSSVDRLFCSSSINGNLVLFVLGYDANQRAELSTLKEFSGLTSEEACLQKKSEYASYSIESAKFINETIYAKVMESRYSFKGECKNNDVKVMSKEITDLNFSVF